MRVAVFSTKPYDKLFIEAANANHEHDLVFFETRLTGETASLASEFPAICTFVNDQLDEPVLRIIAGGKTRLIALRCAGFNNVDLAAAHDLDITVVRVPAYSPYAVAEHAVGLMLTLNRNIHRAYNRVREGNFTLDGLLGFDFNNRTVGIIGTGQIGTVVVKIMNGLGCRLIAHDPYPNPALAQFNVKYTELSDVFSDSDILTLHCPLTPETYHMISTEALQKVKPGVMLINTSRGALLDTPLVIDALKSGKIGYLGLDVYEEESDLFFEDLSSHVIQDDVFARLLTFPNVLVTGHQAFFTRNALEQIASTTLANIAAFECGETTPNEVTIKRLRK